MTETQSESSELFELWTLGGLPLRSCHHCGALTRQIGLNPRLLWDITCDECSEAAYEEDLRRWEDEARRKGFASLDEWAEHEQRMADRST